jgi:hypothetical protein
MATNFSLDTLSLDTEKKHEETKAEYINIVLPDGTEVQMNKKYVVLSDFINTITETSKDEDVIIVNIVTDNIPSYSISLILDYLNAMKGVVSELPTTLEGEMNDSFILSTFGEVQTSYLRGLEIEINPASANKINDIYNAAAYLGCEGLMRSLEMYTAILHMQWAEISTENSTELEQQIAAVFPNQEHTVIQSLIQIAAEEKKG